MDDMEEKASYMDRGMRRKTRCMKVENKTDVDEPYECLTRDRDKVKNNTI